MIRAYRAGDRDACLALFDGNSAPYFAPSERADFAHFLDHDAAKWAFQVAERDGHIVGCGGMAIGGNGRTGYFCWGLVDRTRHRQGIGTALVRVRLDRAAQADVREVRLDTSQHSRAFYERLGFQAERDNRWIWARARPLRYGADASPPALEQRIGGLPDGPTNRTLFSPAPVDTESASD